MLLQFVCFVLAGALRAALLSCGALWSLGVPNWSATCSRRLLGRRCRPLRAAKRAAHSSRPSWVVFALPSVSGGSGTVEGLNFRGRQPPSSFEGRWSCLPFCCYRASQGRLRAIPPVCWVWDPQYVMRWTVMPTARVFRISAHVALFVVEFCWRGCRRCRRSPNWLWFGNERCRRTVPCAARLSGRCRRYTVRL